MDYWEKETTVSLESLPTQTVSLAVGIVFLYEGVYVAQQDRNAPVPKNASVTKQSSVTARVRVMNSVSEMYFVEFDVLGDLQFLEIRDSQRYRKRKDKIKEVLNNTLVETHNT